MNALRMSRAFVSSLTLVTACALLTPVAGPEPVVIVVRNASTVDVAEFGISDADGAPYSRHGSVAPVPAGVSQVLVRPSPPPPLPRHITARWSERSGRTHERAVDLDRVLEGEALYASLALVFTLRGGGELSVSVEHVTP